MCKFCITFWFFIGMLFSQAWANPHHNTIQITMSASYSLELYQEIDNSGNLESRTEKIGVTPLINCSYNEMKRSLHSRPIPSFLDAESRYLGDTLFEIVKAEIRGDEETLFGMQELYDVLTESHTAILGEESLSEEFFNVQPNSTLEIYRLFFRGPGVHYESGLLTTAPIQNTTNFLVDLTLKQIPVLKTIEVVYAESEPRDSIDVGFGENGDINADVNGSNVWLVPKWTTRFSSGITDIKMMARLRSGHAYDRDSVTRNIREGSDGPPRYIKFLRDDNHPKITQIGLYRAQCELGLKVFPTWNGWQYSSKNIVNGRSGNYLFLVWNTAISTN